MDFRKHPWAGQTHTLSGGPKHGNLHVSLPEDTYFAMSPDQHYSFMVTKHDDDGKWYTSWQDQINGGSASSTREGPFPHRQAAEANCRRLLRELLRPN